jgi:DNA-directed RNA polymerase specialized sigma24 family protein
MSVPQPTDGWQELVERARQGDGPAQTRLHDRLRPFVRRRLREAKARRNWFWLTDEDAAVQDVLIQFFQALEDGRFSYEGPERMRGFLVRTTWFVAMNAKDRAVKHRAISLHDDEEGGLKLDVAAFAEAVYDGLDRQECLKLLARTINRLNPNRREIVERTLLGQKVRDICAATGKTPASVSGLKFNALVQLREWLGEEGFEERCGSLFGLSGLGNDGEQGDA